MTQSAQVGRNVRRLRQNDFDRFISFPPDLIFFVLFDISLSLIIWVIGHAGFFVTTHSTIDIPWSDWFGFGKGGKN